MLNELRDEKAAAPFQTSVALSNGAIKLISALAGASFTISSLILFGNPMNCVFPPDKIMFLQNSCLSSWSEALTDFHVRFWIDFGFDDWNISSGMSTLSYPGTEIVVRSGSVYDSSLSISISYLGAT